MFESFMIGLLGRALAVIAFISFCGWVIGGFTWTGGLITFGLAFAASWCKYLSRQTVRVRN